MASALTYTLRHPNGSNRVVGYQVLISRPDSIMGTDVRVVSTHKTRREAEAMKVKVEAILAKIN